MSSSNVQRWFQSHFRSNPYSALTPSTTVSETRIQQRYVLVLLGFVTVVIGTMLQWSLDLTFSHIVTVNTTKAHDPHSCPHLEANISEFPIKQQINGTYSWDEATQTSILGAYSSAILIVQPIAGMIADGKGGRGFLSIGLLVASIVTVLTPLIAEIFDSDGLLYSRYVIGGATAPILPTFFSMITKWMPRKERTVAAVLIFPAALIGRVITMCLTEAIINLTKWKTVFYIYGVIGVIWAAILRKLIYHTPNQHPFISQTEKDYLNDKVMALKRTIERDLDPFPFMAVMKSKVFWAIAAAYTIKDITFTTLTTSIPEYLQSVYWFDLTESKQLYYMLFVTMWVVSILFGLICQLFVSKNMYTLRGARKIFTAVGSLGTAMAIILVGYCNCQTILVTIWLFVGFIASAAFYSGPVIGIMDISENYAGHIISQIDNVSKTMSNLMGYFSRRIVKNALQREWRIYFGIVAGLVSILTFLYLRYIEAHQFWWDDVRTHGYPEGWENGLLPAEAVIDNDGQTIPKPRENQILDEACVIDTEESNSNLV